MPGLDLGLKKPLPAHGLGLKPWHEALVSRRSILHGFLALNPYKNNLKYLSLLYEILILVISHGTMTTEMMCSGLSDNELKFVNAVRENLFLQHIDRPTGPLGNEVQINLTH